MVKYEWQEWQRGPTVDEEPEKQVRRMIEQNGGNISEKLDLYEFVETGELKIIKNLQKFLRFFQPKGRGVLATKDIYTYEKIIHVTDKLVITAPYILEHMPPIFSLMENLKDCAQNSSKIF